MLIFAITMLVIILWIAYETWRSPIYDEDYNIVRPERNLKDLFRMIKNNL